MVSRGCPASNHDDYVVDGESLGVVEMPQLRVAAAQIGPSLVLQTRYRPPVADTEYFGRMAI